MMLFDDGFEMGDVLAKELHLELELFEHSLKFGRGSMNLSLCVVLDRLCAASKAQRAHRLVRVEGMWAAGNDQRRLCVSSETLAQDKRQLAVSVGDMRSLLGRR